MWNSVVDTIAKTDRSFVSLIGRHSRGIELDAGELVVIVRPGKMKLAEDKMGEITRAVKGLYGADIFVTLRAGEPESDPSGTEASSEQETARILGDDANISDVASDIESLFGIKPEITG